MEASPTSRRQPPTSLDSFCYNVSSLQQLARQGSWRSVIDAIAQARKLSLPEFPHEQLVYHAYLVLSHMKLRDYGAASRELDALADLDDPRYQYEFYPSLYPGRTGSMVPFVLRWLYAELPHRLGQTSVTLERLYALFDRCEQRIGQLQKVHTDAGHGIAAAVTNSGSDHVSDAKQHADSVDAPLDSNRQLNPTSEQEASSEKPDGDNVDERLAPQADQADPDESSETTFGEFVSGVNAVASDLEKLTFIEADPQNKAPKSESATAATLRRWQHRQEVIINAIVSHHLNQKDFTVVLKWFKQLLEKHPTDLSLLSKLGYVQMQYGDLSGAKNTFSRVEQMISNTSVSNPLQSSYLKGLVCRNRGLQHVMLKQYTEAIKEFDAAIALNPIDIVSANNKALCYMYSRDLLASTKALESVLDKAPLVALNESLVLNLCSMYELAFVNNVQTKKTLSDWILQIAPDDFDFGCTRL